MSQNKLNDDIEKWQQWALFTFIPFAGIAIFSDNWIFETVAFISAIVFATLTFITAKL